MDIEWIQQTCRRADNRRSGLAARRTPFLLWKQRSGVVRSCSSSFRQMLSRQRSSPSLRVQPCIRTVAARG